MFDVQLTDNTFQLRYPTGVWPENKLGAIRQSIPAISHFVLTKGDEQEQVLSLYTAPDDLTAATNEFFCKLNDYPYHDVSLLDTFQAANAPLVSCIILLPFNDLFTRNVLIPSILQNSRGQAIEIIIVYSGTGVNVDKFRSFRVIESEFGCIAKGYNAGVRAAKGKYVALFHDDCLLDDPDWISTCIGALTDSVKAVAAESDRYGSLVYGKAVPLFLEKEVYMAIGGYDEFYYVGVEDIDLACAFQARDVAMQVVPVRAMHLRGMGSSLVVHPQPRQLKLLYGFQVLPRHVISRIHDDCMKTLVSVPFIKLLEAEYYRYLCEKYQSVLEKNGINVAERIDYFLRKRYPYLLTPYITYTRNRENLIQAYKSLMNLAELSQPIAY